MRHRSQRNYRRLRVERSEDRCLLSAAPFSTPDLSVEPTPTYLTIDASGWLSMDDDSRLASIDFSAGAAYGVAGGRQASDRVDTAFGSTVVQDSFLVATGGLSDDATSVRLSYGGANQPVGLSLVWSSSQRDPIAISPLGAQIADRLTVADPALAGSVLSSFSDRGLMAEGQGSPLADVVQRWLNQHDAFLGGNSSFTSGWVNGDAVTYSFGDGFASTSEPTSWSGTESTTGPSTPGFGSAFTGAESGDHGASSITLGPKGDDLENRSRLPAILREWLGGDPERAVADGLSGQEQRTRSAAGPLQRVAESPAPPAGDEAPRAGMIDLAELLLPTADADDAPSVVLAAASRSADELIPLPARDAALAVESWVRTLPVPGEVVGVVEGVAPPTQNPAVGVRTDVPVKQDAPRPQAAKDHVSRSGDPSDGVPTLAKGAPTPAERIDEQRADDVSGYVAAWLTTLLGGAMVWANRRSGRNRASDCIETPRRETSRNA